MADGSVGAAISQGAKDIHEAVVKPVVDEVGKAIEEGVQAVVSGPKVLDPQAQQKKQEEEQKRKAWALRVIDWYKKLQDEQLKVRQAKQQQQMQVQQSDQQEKQVKQFKVMEEQKKKTEMTQLQRASRKSEIKGGMGG